MFQIPAYDPCPNCYDGIWCPACGGFGICLVIALAERLAIVINSMRNRRVLTCAMPTWNTTENAPTIAAVTPGNPRTGLGAKLC